MNSDLIIILSYLPTIVLPFTLWPLTKNTKVYRYSIFPIWFITCITISAFNVYYIYRAGDFIIAPKFVIFCVSIIIIPRIVSCIKHFGFKEKGYFINRSQLEPGIRVIKRFYVEYIAILLIFNLFFAAIAVCIITNFLYCKPLFKYKRELLF